MFSIGVGRYTTAQWALADTIDNINSLRANNCVLLNQTFLWDLLSLTF